MTPNATIPGSDFIAPPRPKRRAVVLLFGLPAHGKSTAAAIGAPGPVAWIDVDHRALHVIEEEEGKTGKKFHYLSLEYPASVVTTADALIKIKAQEQVARAMRNFDIVLKENEKGNIRTCVIDTMTEYAEIVNMAITGKAERKNDDYGKSAGLQKAQLSQMIKAVRQSKLNLIMLARAKEIWVDKEPTGRFTYRGPDTVEYDADWAGHIRIKPKKVGSKVKTASPAEFELEVTKAGLDSAELGQVYEADDWGNYGPFVYGCIRNFPGSKPGDWK